VPVFVTAMIERRDGLVGQDGPMLELLKAFPSRQIELPTRRVWRRDARFERFQMGR
jgi:hypothetical protein